MPPLNALRVFEAAARHESLTLAAVELNVAHAAVSRHIRTLEAFLRTALFERTGRGVRLTDEGRALANALTEAFDVIAGATSRYARGPRRRRPLTITSDVAFATHWLVPRLGGFTSEHPGIDLVVDANHRLIDFTKEDINLGIRFGGGAWKNVQAEKLAGAEFSLVCHPRLLKAKSVRSPRDLPDELLMQEDDWALWPAWLEAAGLTGVVPSGPRLLHDLTLTAAEAGQGFALADCIVAADALFAGRLVRPFDITIRDYGYYLVRRPDGVMSKAALSFRNWLKAEIDRTLAAVAALTTGERKTPKKPRRRA